MPANSKEFAKKIRISLIRNLDRLSRSANLVRIERGGIEVRSRRMLRQKIRHESG